MDAAGKAALIEYAEFLVKRHPAIAEEVEIQDIQRPESESVVAAIKRLSATYPMLDRQALLHETSAFMMQHIMQGRAAESVIDEMQVYFKQQYEQFRLKNSDDTDT